MSEKIDQFVENLRDRLNAVDDRINNFKSSIDSANAKADVQARLDKAKAGYEARKSEIEKAHQRVKASIEEKKTETDGKIAEWKDQRETKKLEKRAQRAEEYAVDQLWFAMVAVEEADYAAIEAIAARIEADEAAAG
jgi:chromosome segregation ATPase